MARRRPREVKLVSASVSSLALEALFESQAEKDLALIDALHKRVHRTAVWKYRKRRGRPDLDTANVMEVLTGGRVPAAGWSMFVDTERGLPATGTEGR